MLEFRYVLSGSMRRVRVPAEGPPERAGELWRHTCFEAFVRRDRESGYLEFNFAPSGQWQALQFSAYRQGMESAELPACPSITVGHRERAQPSAATADERDDALVLEALVPLSAPYVTAGLPLRLGLGAVVEDQAGGLSYWALYHPAERPDFHHPAAFVLSLDWARTEWSTAIGSEI